jgi:hypothetical protein
LIDDDLDDMIHALGVRVEYVEMPPDRDGEYLHGRRLIRLQRGMARRLHRWVKAHECGHAVHAHQATRFGPVNAKNERQADEWAALRLITLPAYKRAEILHNGHTGAMAVELDVVVDAVEVFRSMLLTVQDEHGMHTYLQPRMGDGQWVHRELTRHA